MGSLFKSKRSIKTIFFDIGGVVVKAPMDNFLKYGSEIYECEPRILEHVTAQILPELERGRIDSDQFWEAVTQALVREGRGKDVPTWRFKGFWEGILSDSLELDRGLIDLVRRLKAHVRVAALTNVIEEHAKVMARQNVYEHFNPVVLSCKLGERKPDLEAYKKAAEMVKTAPDRCMLVDDCPKNLEGAEKAGYRIHHFVGLDELKREMYNLGFVDHA